MIPVAFEYLAPTTLDEALSALSTHTDAKILAGGHSLIPAMKLRLASPKYLIDISRISDLNYIRESGGQILIGAGTTHYQIESSTLLKEKCPLLTETAPYIGDVQVRNRGTLGGSLAHADPAADWPAAILAVGAEMKVRSSRGERTLKAEDFFVDMMTTALQPNEILTEIRIPIPPQRTGSAYEKVKQPASGFALVGVAVQITLDTNRTCRQVQIGITGLAPKPFRATGVENMLKGKAIDDQLLAQAAEKAADGVDPLSDIHASAEYRSHLARVHTKRALQRAVSRI